MTKSQQDFKLNLTYHSTNPEGHLGSSPNPMGRTKTFRHLIIFHNIYNFWHFYFWHFMATYTPLKILKCVDCFSFSPGSLLHFRLWLCRRQSGRGQLWTRTGTDCSSAEEIEIKIINKISQNNSLVSHNHTWALVVWGWVGPGAGGD